MNRSRVHPLACGLGFAFLVENDQGLYLIDSGSPGQENRVLKKMSELGHRTLQGIWITHAHYDHYGNAAALRSLTGAWIGVHPADASSMIQGRSPLGSWRSYGFLYPAAQRVANRLRPLCATPPDFTLGHGETLERYGLNAAVLHTPGHTPGHTCLLLDESILFAGDLIGAFPRPVLQRLLATDWNQLPSSLEVLKRVQPGWVYTGHRPRPIPGSVAQTILP